MPEISSALLNEAVQFCTNAYNKAHSAARAAKEKDYECIKKANRAYKLAMPRLTNYTNMRSFLTCVTYGMIIEVFTYEQGSKLLYAAQIALRSLSHETRDTRPAGRPKSAHSVPDPTPASDPAPPKPTAAPTDTPSTPTADPAIAPAAAVTKSKSRCRLKTHHPSLFTITSTCLSRAIYRPSSLVPASQAVHRRR
jgi:hypothetical protein